MLGLILVILLIVILLGALPTWPYSRDWGPAPFGGLLTLILVIFIILYITGNLHVRL
jgi:Protein of unknown function (DUF3309)